MTTMRSATSIASSWSWVTKTLVTCISSCRRRSQRRSSLRTLRVERAERLVEQQHLGLDRERARERDALALAAGELVRIAVGEPVELHEREQLVDLGADLRLVRAASRFGPHAQAEGDVLEDRHVAEQRVVLEDEADLALAHVGAGRVLAVEAAPLPASGTSRPAMMRSSVVLPEPDGPSSATSSPARMSRLEVVADDGRAEALVQVADFDAHACAAPLPSRCRSCTRRSTRVPSARASPAPARRAARRRRRRRRTGIRCRGSRCAAAACWSGRGCGRRRRSRRRTRPSPARCRGSRRRAAPTCTFGSVTRRKICQPPAPSTRAASSCSVPCACISGISSRATNGKVTKTVASTMPGSAKMIFRSCVAQPLAEPALQAEDEHEDQAGDHRRDRERQVDQREQQVLAAEVELGDRPRRGDAEDEVQRHAIAAASERQPDRRQRVGLGDRGEVDVDALAAAPRRRRRPAARTGRARGSASATRDRAARRTQRRLASVGAARGAGAVAHARSSPLPARASTPAGR